jgi:hypothetical protein
LGHKRLFAPQQHSPLFNHFLGAAEQGERERKAQRLRGPEVDGRVSTWVTAARPSRHGRALRRCAARSDTGTLRSAPSPARPYCWFTADCYTL